MKNKEIKLVVTAIILFGIIIGVVIYIFTREVKQTLSRTSTAKSQLSNGDNMNIEHNQQYDQTVRGYRNNNPLNLRISSNAWKGKVPLEQNTDGTFEQFTTMAYGFRAALKNLQTYISIYGCDTITTITNKWAPVSDGNNPTRYADVVSSRTGISKTSLINANDKETMCKIAAAMAYMENGSSPVMQDVYNAWNML